MARRKGKRATGRCRCSAGFLCLRGFIGAGGVQALRAVGVGHIRVDACGHAASAAEGAALALFTYDENKRAESRETVPTLELLG